MATDSFKAVCLKLDTPENEITKMGDSYPLKENDKPLILKEGEQLFVHKDVVDDLKFKGNRNAKVLNNLAILLEWRGENPGSLGSYKIRIDDLTTATTYEANKNHWHFPDIENITKKILEKPAKDRVKVNIEYFIEALQTLQARGSTNCVIESRELDGVIITPGDEENYDSYAIVMPLKF